VVGQQRQRGESSRVADRGRLGDAAAAVGEADDVRLLELEGVERGNEVGGDVVHRERGR
jgi:hypothetical protein